MKVGLHFEIQFDYLKNLFLVSQFLLSKTAMFFVLEFIG